MKILKLFEKVAQIIVFAEKSDILYHGSHKYFDIVKPKDEHGDPDVDSAIFATPSKIFALPYCGKKWGNRDLEQSTDTKKEMHLREMRPNVFEEIFDTSGYLYFLPKDTFKAAKNRRTYFEVVSCEKVKPIKIIKIDNVLKELKNNPKIILHKYDPKNPATRTAIKRYVKRMNELSPKEAKEHEKWWMAKMPIEMKKIWNEEKNENN